jgi:hypothetical protein
MLLLVFTTRSLIMGVTKVQPLYAPQGAQDGDVAEPEGALGGCCEGSEELERQDESGSVFFLLFMRNHLRFC